MTVRRRGSPVPGATRGAGGFTIIELLVVMGMLGLFLLSLTQILSDSLRIWQRGEERAAQEDRAATALDMLSGDLRRVQGLSDRHFVPGREARFAQLAGSGNRPPLAGRLYAQWRGFLAEGVPADAEAMAERPEALDWHPELRVVCALDTAETQALLTARLRQEIEENEGVQSERELREKVRARLAEIPSRHPAEVALRVLPTGEEGGCYLALFRDRRLLDGSVSARWVDGAALPAPSQPLLGNLLYVEFLFRSQYTRSFDAAPRSEDGPEHCWDSARAGTFGRDHPVLAFSLDLDAESLSDPLDDVMPSAVQIRVVVDESPDRAYCALLGAPIDAETNEIRIDYAERLPVPVGRGNYIKIGGEWIRYGGVERDRLVGVRRGQRFTRARPHAAGARVHAGREAKICLPIAVAREYWNG